MYPRVLCDYIGWLDQVAWFKTGLHSKPGFALITEISFKKVLPCLFSG